MAGRTGSIARAVCELVNLLGSERIASDSFVRRSDDGGDSE
jgi:hypothetical protein